MTRILAVIDRLHFTGPGRLLRDLALAHGSMRLLVLTGPAGPWGEQLRAAGVEVECLNWHWTLDVKPWRRLRAIQDAWQPGVVHAWGWAAARWTALSGWRGRTLATLSFPPGRHGWGRLDRWLLRHFEKFVCTSTAEANRAREHGWPAERVEFVPPGMAVAPDEPPADLPGVPAAAPVVLCVGDLLPGRGAIDAIWATDILRFLFPDVRLVFVGAGPEQPRLERFAARNDLAGMVHFVGEQGNLGGWFARASVVWCPARREMGADAVLAALAHGRPVVAYNWPALAELLAPGRTGDLVPVGDKTQLAQATRAYLDDPERVGRVGAEARQAVRDRFAAAGWLAAWQRLYG